MEYMHPNAAPFFLEGGSHAVLLTHGFTGSCGHMRPLGEYLNRCGYTVCGILLPGHGTSIQDMRSSGWKQWLDAEMTALADLKRKYPYVSVSGLSMGGCLSLIAAGRESVTACIPISAPMKTLQKFTFLAPVLALFKPEIMWEKGAVNDKTFLDPEFNVGYAGMPTARVGDLNRLMKMARESLGRIRCPVLAIQSHGDETISRDSSDIICREAASAVKKQLWLEEVPHVCTISREKDHIGQEICAFLKKAEDSQAAAV